MLSLSMLPPGVEAVEFERQDFVGCLQGVMGGDRARAEKTLLLWYFEDQLKAHYAKLVAVLAEVGGWWCWACCVCCWVYFMTSSEHNVIL